jgi:uncharacterized protein YyaL (SSP411 family)
MSQPPFTNRLLHETSPYLKQHAHNPVDWYPWGEEALRRARELDRPIFLSIGYSACHWCHVMEHESFEDPEVGRFLNEHFVSIKVDREERPDLDQLYMTAVQLLTGQGGWPMSMFLTPSLKPFYGGTYFPPDERHGRPSFKRVLESIIRAWQTQREQVEEQSGHVTEGVRQAVEVEPAAGDLTADLLQPVVASLRRIFDSTYGGFGQAPKFPHSMEIRLLLRLWRRFGDDEALRMATTTLDGMALGGMYDHLGGGFHRYSTDRRWLVPHFEKMLYDNALLTVAYLEAFQATGNPLYHVVVEETLGYVLREMTSPEGGFYSTQDADSEGEEGKFFVWSVGEVEEVLGVYLSAAFRPVYGVMKAEGNWEHGKNILHRTRPFDQDAQKLGLSESELRERLNAAKLKLFDVRSRRVWPHRDEKMLTAWNGLMIAAFARAAQVLDEPDFATAATRAADFVLRTMRQPDGRLWRTYSSGSAPKLNGYLEDYAFLIEALAALYETTFEPRWLERALELSNVMIDQFWDAAEGGFFFTGKDHEQLIARSKDPQDNATPSGNAVAATALLRLAELTGRADLRDKALGTLRRFRGLLASSPMAAGQMLIALDFHLGPVDEVAVVGVAGSDAVRAALRLVRGPFRPHQVVAFTSGSDPAAERIVPLLAGKTALGAVTTYLCREFTCQAPLVGVEALRAALGK